MIELHYNDNMKVEIKIPIDLVYADYIYGNKDFYWIDKYWNFLQPNGIFMAQTDDSTFHHLRTYLDNLVGSDRWLNTLIYKQEWGGVPKRKFPQKHDYIVVYAKGNDYTWRGDRIQIPKKTAGTAFDKKGTGMKTPCSVFDDLGNFSTMSKEREKNSSGKNIQWQKPLKLMNRLFLPFTNEGDTILAPFMGSASGGEWCKDNLRNYIGVENEEEPFRVSYKRLTGKLLSGKIILGEKYTHG